MKFKTKHQGDIEISSITFPIFIIYQNEDEFDQLNNQNYLYLEQKKESNLSPYGFIATSIENIDWADGQQRNCHKDYVKLTYSEFLEFENIYVQKIQAGEFIIKITEENTPYLNKYLSKFSTRYSNYQSYWKIYSEAAHLKKYVFAGTTTENVHSSIDNSRFNNHLDLITITTEEFLKYYKDILDEEKPISSTKVGAYKLNKDEDINIIHSPKIQPIPLKKLSTKFNY